MQNFHVPWSLMPYIMHTCRTVLDGDLNQKEKELTVDERSIRQQEVA